MRIRRGYGHFPDFRKGTYRHFNPCDTAMPLEGGGMAMWDEPRLLSLSPPSGRSDRAPGRGLPLRRTEAGRRGQTVNKRWTGKWRVRWGDFLMTSVVSVGK